MIRRVPSSLLSIALIVLIALIALAISMPVLAQVKERDTIKSLENKTFEVRPGKLIVNSTDKARDSYRAFLDLVSDDPELRAEAMRRLADLELDAAETQQMADDLDNLGSPAAENAAALFSQLLEAYPDYRRNDTVLYSSRGPTKRMARWTIHCAC